MERSPDLYGLRDRVIIVTGSSSGIGLSTTLLLIQHGAKVFGVDKNPAPPSLPSKSKSDDGVKYTHHIANLLDRSSASTIVAACTAAYGPKIDALVNNAGVGDHMESADTVTDEEWDRVIAINLTAPVALMRAVLPHMLGSSAPGTASSSDPINNNGDDGSSSSGSQQGRPGGSIVNVASTAGFSGACSGVAYTSSKHGLVGASRNVAWRFQDEGVRCNVVCPGPTDTAIGASIDPSKFDMGAVQRLAKVWGPVHGLKMPGVGEDGKGDGEGKNGGGKGMAPEKVAQMLVWLCSGLSDGVSGAVLPVDAGICAVGS